MFTLNLPRHVRAVLANVPKAGDGVNLWLFRAARVLHAHCCESDIIATLEALTYGCGRSIKPGEIERAVRNSRAAAPQIGQRTNTQEIAKKWPPVNQEQIQSITRSRVGLYDLWEASPIRLNGDTSNAVEIIARLFPSDPLLCVGKSASQFATRPLSVWSDMLSSMQFIVPSPMSARAGRTQEGKESAHTLENTGPRRFLVIEFDEGTTDTHAALLLYLAERAPLALVVHSGSKSLHGWFYCLGQPEERLHTFMRHAVSLGADRATWTRSQFVRMPDGSRANSVRQTVYYYRPEVVQ